MNIVTAQRRSIFTPRATLDIDFRIDALKKLKAYVQSHESEIAKAIALDLGKSSFESYMCETGMVLSELTHMSTARALLRKRKACPDTHSHRSTSRSYKQPSPYGVTLVS